MVFGFNNKDRRLILFSFPFMCIFFRCCLTVTASATVAAGPGAGRPPLAATETASGAAPSPAHHLLATLATLTTVEGLALARGKWSKTLLVLLCDVPRGTSRSEKSEGFRSSEGGCPGFLFMSWAKSGKAGRRGKRGESRLPVLCMLIRILTNTPREDGTRPFLFPI